MFRLKTINTINNIDEAIVIMNFLGYPIGECQYFKHDDYYRIMHKEYETTVICLLTPKTPELIIYPMTYAYSQSQWDDRPGLPWERSTIDARVDKAIKKLLFIKKIIPINIVSRIILPYKLRRE